MGIDDQESIRNKKKLQNIAKKQRLAEERFNKLEQCYKYYAGVDTPLDRICEHLAVSEEDARYGLSRYGRAV